MSLQYTRLEFRLCPRCAVKPGSPELCAECLERRELWFLVDKLRRGELKSSFPFSAQVKRAIAICMNCQGRPNPECKEHGR